MSGQLGELVISLAADTARFRSDLGKATKATQDSAREMSAHFDKMGGAIKTTIGLMAGFAGAASLGSLVKSSIDAADNMSKMSQKVGVAIEQLSGMSYAAGLADVSTEQLGKGMGKLAKTMYDAFKDGKGSAADTFRNLGISVTDASGQLRGTDAVMMDVAERLSRMDDGAAKTAISMEIFGKAGADLIPLLNGGKKGLQEAADEAKRFGLVLSAEAGRQAEEFNDNLTRLKSLSSGVAITIANELLPQINEIVGKFAQGGDISNGPFMNGLRSVKAEFIRLAMLVDKAGGSMTAAGMLLYGPGSALGNENSKKQFEKMAEWNIMFEERYKESEKAMQTMANLEVGLDSSGNPFKPKKASSGAKGGTLTPNKSNAAEESGRQKKLADESIKKLKEQEEAFYNLGQEIEQTADAAERVFNIMANQGGAFKTDRYNTTNVFDSDRPSLLEPGSIGTAGTKKGGYSLLSDAPHSIRQEGPDLTFLEEENAKKLQLEQDFQKSMSDLKIDAASSALGLMRAAAGDNKALQIAAMVGEKALAIARIMMNTEVAASAAIAAAAMIPVGGVAIGAANAAAIRAMSYVSIGMVLASGIIEGVNIAGARALGGPVVGGSTYLVGENGPELFTPGVTGAITPNSAMGGQSVQITQSFNITGVAADITQNTKAIAKQAADSAKNEILQSMNRGSTYARAVGRA